MPSYILITGGTGFIGSHTAVELLNENYHIIIIDNLSNSSPSVLLSITDITKKQPIFIQGDYGDMVVLDRVFTEYKITCVIHFAGFKAVAESNKYPLMYYDNNVGGTIRLLQAMIKYSCKNIIFSSSAVVYGSHLSPPFTEEMHVDISTIQNAYGRTKYMIELILADVCASEPGFNAIVLRYFNPIGAHESGLIGERPQGIPNNLFPYILKVVLSTDKLKVFGDNYDTPDGTCIRDYIHIVDLSRAHLLSLNHILSKKCNGLCVFNVGTGKGTSVKELLTLFEESTGVAIVHDIIGRRTGDLPIVYADSTKIRNTIGWAPVLTIGQACIDAYAFSQM